jgi:prepilin-type N-terminal cleavage/methylation domain-containing protein
MNLATTTIVKRGAIFPCRVRGGMTLVEVLLAIAILGTSLVALLVACSRCLAVMKIAQRYQGAQWTMGAAEVDHPIYETNDVESLVVEPQEYPGGYVYSRALEDEPFDEKHHLYLMRIRVKWADRGSETMEEVVRCFYQPKDEDKPKP